MTINYEVSLSSIKAIPTILDELNQINDIRAQEVREGVLKRTICIVCKTDVPPEELLHLGWLICSIERDLM